MTRNLGRHGIKVRISGTSASWGLYSRYCHEALPVPAGRSAADYWKELLIDNLPERVKGSIVIPCNDEAIEFMLENHSAILANFIIDDIRPEIHRKLLDKKATLELARSVDVPAPNFWTVNTIEDVRAIAGEVTFPLMVKPIHSHKFNREFGRKLFIIENSFDELVEKAALSLDRGHEIMVVEMIPGPDALLTSYFTYLDSDDRHLFHFTKRVPRRYPVNRGGGCYHETKWLPETAELGRRFFTGIGFRGMGNIEFKRDTRDGKLKVIEVNTRFTAVHELIIRAGLPIDLMVYCRLSGQRVPRRQTFADGRRMWYPLHDFLAFRELNRRGELGFGAWLASVARLHLVFPTFSLRDPWPFLVSTAFLFKRF
ncbi:MAG: carboxylate--amine ligase, partial [Alphaproteobacteria bacterium]